MPVRIKAAEPQEMRVIEAYLEYLRQLQRTEKTISGRREVLYRLNRELPYGIGQVADSDLRAWLYRDGWSQNTRATYYQAIKSFYDWACAHTATDASARRCPARRRAGGERSSSARPTEERWHPEWHVLA